MIKGIAALPLLLLAGCALTPEKATQLSDLDVCTKMIGGSTQDAQVAFQEASRRGLDCNDYAAIIAARQAQARADKESRSRALMGAWMMSQPRQIQCTSVQQGVFTNTTCR